MLMSGSLLYGLNLMTNDEPDGGLAIFLDVLPNHDVVVDGLDGAKVDVAVVVSSSWSVAVVVAALAVLMMDSDVSVDHFGCKWPDGVKNSLKTCG